MTGLFPGKRCPACGSALFERPACCKGEEQGIATVLKCTRFGCGHIEPYRLVGGGVWQGQGNPAGDSRGNAPGASWWPGRGC